jgi:hypothetical protein
VGAGGRARPRGGGARRADSRAGPAFRVVCHGPKGAPPPPGWRCVGVPRPPPGGLGRRGRPAICTGARRPRKDAPIRGRVPPFGVCVTDRRGPRPLPAGGAQGSPDPPPGGLGPRGRAAICTGARRLRKDAQIRPGPGQRDPTFRWGGDRVLFIGTQFSNRYTAVDTPARGRVVVCLVFVCKYVLGPSRVSQPLNLRLCLLRHLGFLTSPHASPTCCRRRLNSYRLLRRSTPGPPSIPWAHLFHLPASPRPPLYTPTMTT